MTQREKQAKFRRKVKEILVWTLIMSAPYLLLIDWIIIGYK